MPQLANRDAAMDAPTGVITVADLLSRYSPATVEPEPPTEPVTVASLLQREGRGPLGPTSRDPEPAVAFEVTEYAEDEGARPGPSGTLVKRGAIAAGVLLAAGSAIGVTVVNTAAPTTTTPTALDDQTPDRNWLDPQAAATVPALPSAEQLDPGAAPDQSWMEVAFPSPSDSVHHAPADGAAPTGPSGGGNEQVPGGGAPAGGTDGGSNGGGSGPAAGAAALPVGDEDHDHDGGSGTGSGGHGSGDSDSGDSDSGGHDSGGAGGSGNVGSGSGSSGNVGSGGGNSGGGNSAGVGGVVNGLVGTVAGLL